MTNHPNRKKRPQIAAKNFMAFDAMLAALREIASGEDELTKSMLTAADMMKIAGEAIAVTKVDFL